MLLADASIERHDPDKPLFLEHIIQKLAINEKRKANFATAVLAA
jgi:hypothetical protein